MTTYIFTKKAMLESIKKFPDNKIFLVSTNPDGQISATGKKGKEIKKIPFAFAGSCFKNPRTISDILNSWIGGLIIMDRKYLSDEDKKDLRKQEKDAKVENG